MPRRHGSWVLTVFNMFRPLRYTSGEVFGFHGLYLLWLCVFIYMIKLYMCMYVYIYILYIYNIFVDVCGDLLADVLGCAGIG